MANFYEAYGLTSVSEGKYSRHKSDFGGETYKGITRTYQPNWGGWKIIDKYKSNPSFPQCLYKDEQLNKLVVDFYRDVVWKEMQGEKIKYQLIAYKIFDIAVNMGSPKSVKYFQRAVNILNQNQRLYKDITVDGIMGDESFSALDLCVRYNGLKRLYNVLCGYQIMHYIKRMEEDSTQEDFPGWFDRVVFQLVN